MSSPRESHGRSVSPSSPRGRGRSYSPCSSAGSYYDRSLSRSRSRSRSFSHQQPHVQRGHRSRSPHRSTRSRIYRYAYSRSPSPRPRYHASPPPRRYRSRSPLRTRRMSRPINSKARVYVRNLSFDVKWHHLKDFMRQAGEVVHVDVVLLPNGRPTGCGIVDYRYAEYARRAIHTLHNVELMGRPVFVHKDREYDGPPRPAKDRHEAPGGYRIFVGNLPHLAGWQDMKDLFRKAGQVLHADINTDSKYKRLHRTGTVVFGDSKTAHAAIDMFNGYEWDGNKLQVGEENAMLSKARGTSTRTMSVASSSSTVSVLPPVPQPSPPSVTTQAPSSTIQTETTPPLSSQLIENIYPSSETIRQQIEPEYNTGYQDMYRHGQDTMASMYNMSLVGGPCAHLPNQGQNQIFVNNLPFSTNWQDLIDLFRHVGPVVRSEVLTINGHPKGAGFVRFESTSTCEKAIVKFNGFLYGGRHLDISLDTRE